MERRYLEIAEVEAIHQHVIDRSGGLHGVRDRGLLESAIFRPRMGYYADVIEEAAALMESLVQNHPFHDGNKRTAFVASNAFLRLNGFRIRTASESAEQFFLHNLRNGTFRFNVIVEWLRAVVRAD